MGLDLKVMASHFRERRGEVLSTATLRFDRDDERVVAGDAVGQGQEPLGPVMPGVAEPLDLLEAIGPQITAQRGTARMSHRADAAPSGPPAGRATRRSTGRR